MIGPTQIYFLLVLSIICLSYTLRVYNYPKYPASLRTDNQNLVPVLRKTCLSGPVGPTISEKSDIGVAMKCIIVVSGMIQIKSIHSELSSYEVHYGICKENSYLQYNN